MHEEMPSQYNDSIAEPSIASAADLDTAEEPSLLEPSLGEHRIPTAQSDVEYEIPQPLQQLISSGRVKLVAAPDSMWSIDGYAAKLFRTLSVSFSVDHVVSGEEVVEAFYKLGVDVEDIASVQYRGSNRSWCVSFRSKEVKEQVLEKGVVRFGDSLVFIGDVDFRTVIVKVYEAPPEMPDTVVVGRLSHYGRVLAFCRDYGAVTRILNGVRTARMRLSSSIPSSIRIAGEQVFVSYPGQPKTCRRCGEEGHMAQGCRKPRCFNCECPGHVASDCDSDPLSPVTQCRSVRTSFSAPTWNPWSTQFLNRRTVDSGGKRKADTEPARSQTPEEIPVTPGSPRSADGRGKVRWHESAREDHQRREDRSRADQPHVDRDRNDDSDDHENQHQWDERRENR